MRLRAGIGFTALAGALVLVVSGCTWTSRVSVDSNGAQGNDYSWQPAISADGHYVAFGSLASNLVPGDTNGDTDIFVKDTTTGATTRVSVDSGGAEANSASLDPTISGDGRYIAFDSNATNLVPGDTNNVGDVFLRDTALGTTTRITLSSDGAQADNESFDPAISADGRYVAFTSWATNLVPGDTNGEPDVFVWDAVSGTTTRVSVDSSAGQGNLTSDHPSISGDGRYIAFESWATNLVPGDTNGRADIFVRDTTAGTTVRVSVDSSGGEGNDWSSNPAISADGRDVAFTSWATNLVPGDTNVMRDLFVRDTVSGTTTAVSLDGGLTSSSSFPAISADGRYVAFESDASTLVPGDTNDATDVFARDMVSGSTTRVSVNSGGGQADGTSDDPAISADGRYVAFHSSAPNLVAGDTNGAEDVFVRANPVVTVSGTTPGEVAPGAVSHVTITGTGFQRGVDVSAGSGVSVSGVVVVNESAITATFTVDPAAVPGPRTITVTIPGTGAGALTGSTGLCVACLTIT